MLTHSTLNRIPLAVAAEVAARLPGTRREGAGYRTRGYCHNSGDKPTSASLVFSDPPRPGEQSLRVHCYKCSPQTPAETRCHPPRPAKGNRPAAVPSCRRLLGSTTARAGRPNGATTRPAVPQAAHAGHDTAGAASSALHRTRSPSRNGAHTSFPGTTPADAPTSSPCPLCRQPDALIAWTLADHPFPYAGLSLRCQCTASYDQLHKHVAAQISAKGRQWRQDAVYILADGRRPAAHTHRPGQAYFLERPEGHQRQRTSASILESHPAAASRPTARTSCSWKARRPPPPL